MTAYFFTLGIVVCLGALAYFIGSGVSARPQPRRLEALIARTTRDVAIAWHAPDEPNPVAATEEAVADGQAHFADHCASCHANNGSGDTELGRSLYPRAPDMRLAATQSMSDHQLFYIIENGIRLTGMPGWSTGTTEGEEASWRLVHFIRRLPNLTAEDIESMEALNPKTSAQWQEEEEARRFLQGDVKESLSTDKGHRH